MRIRENAGFSIWDGGVRQSGRAGRLTGRRTRSAGRLGSRAKQRRIGRRRNVSALLCGGAFGLLHCGARPCCCGAARDMRPRRLRRIPSIAAVRAFKQGGAVKLRSASEKRPVNAMPPSACVSRRKPAFGAAAHRSQKIGGAKALLLIGCAEPEREERRGDTQTGAGTPFPERRDTAGGQTHPTAVHRKRLREGTAMRECGNPLHPLEHANPGQGHLLQALALAAERYAERRSRNAGKAFREAADTAARPRRAAARISQEQDFCGAYPEFVSAAPRRIGSVPIRFCAVAGIGKPTAVPMHLSEATI